MAVEGNTRNRVNGERNRGTAESKTPSMSGNHKRENREIPAETGRTQVRPERTANATGGNADRLTAGKSDESVVPATSTNNDASEASAEPTERNRLVVSALFRIEKGPSPMVGNDRWAWHPWRTRLSNRRCCGFCSAFFA